MTSERLTNHIRAALLVASILVLSGTALSWFHLIWLISVFIQALMGAAIVGLLSTRRPLSRSMRFLIGSLVGLASYAWVYQGFLRLIEKPTFTWLLSNLVAIGVAISRRRHLVSHITKTTPSDTGNKIWTPSASEIFGGGVLIAGLTTMRSLFAVGAGILISGLLGSKKSQDRGLRSKTRNFVLAISFAISALMSWNLDRPFGRFWMISSNDLQTALSLSVSTSLFGFWDSARFSGSRDTYHWAIYGWAGMSAPFGDQLVAVTVLMPIVVCVLLFWATAVFIERAAMDLGIASTHKRVVASVAAASMFVASGLSSVATQFGMLTVLCLALLLRDWEPTKGRIGTLPLVIAMLFISVWSNALSIAFLTVICSGSVLIRLVSYPLGTWRNLRQSLALHLCTALLGWLFWVLLYLPASRSGSFRLSPLANRGSNYPELSRLLGSWNPETRALTFELFDNTYFLLALFGFTVLGTQTWRKKIASLETFLSIGAGAVFMKLLFTGYETGKFSQWGTLGTVGLFGLIMISLLSSETAKPKVTNRSVSVNLVTIASIAFSGGLLHEISPSFQMYRLMDLTSALPFVIVVCGLLLYRFLHRGLPMIFVSSVLVVVSLLGFRLGEVVGYHARESFDQYEISRSQPSALRWMLNTSIAVEDVADFLRTQTPRGALIASNYFCDDGTSCPVDRVLQSDLADLTPSLWGLQADMSNLAALSHRRFLIQSPRHVFGNYVMSVEAKKRWRIVAEFALLQSDRDELLKYNTDYFVLDWDSVPERPRVELADTVYENSRFTVIDLRHSQIDS